MNKKADTIGIIALLLTVFTLIFGDNIYQQMKGHSVFQNSPLPITESPINSQVIPTQLSTEITYDKGPEMILVPAGEFIMGSDNGAEDIKPAHRVYLDSYYIDKFEVTNVFYKACVSVGGCSAPRDITKYNNSQYANHPVVHVDWNQAKTYCEWRGVRLPTEAEWEKAARGTDGRTYPWGEELDCSKANYAGCIGDTTAVDIYEDGKSPYGVYDMAGNVLEWVSDLVSEFGPEYRVSHGGSWYSDIILLPSFHRYDSSPEFVSGDIGFRCAIDAPP